MMEFTNVMHPPMFTMESDQTILEAVPPPELHMMMGATNHLLELMRIYLEHQGQEAELWEWCDGHGITQRGKDSLNFPSSNAFIMQATMGLTSWMAIMQTTSSAT